jgi:tetratricopeptide (TPR) repeat protein
MNAIRALEERLGRYPPGRYPVQHATAQFHLGLALTEAGRLDEAETALTTAAGLFPPDRLQVEHAKATNALGVVFRLAGRPEAAATAFRKAAALFEAAGLTVEQGAALFNLGLVQRELGDTQAAVGCFEEARARLDPDRVPIEAAAAARELGAALLVGGELDAARAALEAAMELAGRAGDQAGLGAAANILGLAQLAGDLPEQAVEAFRSAVAGHPRSLRPEEYAMAKANLALAYERAGDRPRARLTAGQAVSVAGAAAPVLAQARAILDRLGDQPGTLLQVLDLEVPERWLPILREELARWVAADPVVRVAEAGAMVDGVLARPAAAQDLAEAWLAALLELPPEEMTGLIRAALQAVRERDATSAGRLRSVVTRAMARFPIPQWTRLEHTFAHVAAGLGLDGSWRSTKT